LSVRPTARLSAGKEKQMNRMEFIGRLTRDPEKPDVSGDISVVKLRVAIPRRKKGGEDQGAVFIDVTAFGKQGDLCAEYLEKGRQVAVSGRLEYSEYKDAEGNPRSRHEVIVDEIDFLGGPREGADGPSERELAGIASERGDGPDF
jgi:single-strand DNA-binding protein